MSGTGSPIIFGEVLFDRFPDGHAVLGGAPFNVAWNLQALGLRPRLVSRIGRDELGEEILGAMVRWGMDTSGVQIDAHRSTGIVEITVQNGEPEYDIALGKAYDYITAAGLPPGADGTILYHGTLALRTDPPREALDALIRGAGCPVLVDVNLRAPWWSRDPVLARLAGAKWGKLNEGELAGLLPSLPDTRARARQLLRRGDLEVLVVTRGADGVWVGTRGGETWEGRPAAQLPVADTVGAGDAFSSVMMLGLVHGWDWPRIVERALAFAGAVVGLRGATTDDRRFYERFATDWEKS